MAHEDGQRGGHVQELPCQDGIAIPWLPQLSSSPTTYPGCCLGLSIPLLDNIYSILSTSQGHVLSIGSGYGLLEALLLSPPYNLHVTGVEVHPSSNQYLPSWHHQEVSGSRFLSPLAQEARVWMFVYPKRVGLVDEYIAARQGQVKTIIWAGPKADWEDYEPCFKDWCVENRSADEVGGRAWEMLAIATKPPSP